MSGLFQGLPEVYVWMPGGLGSATRLPVGLGFSTCRSCWLASSNGWNETHAVEHSAVAVGSAEVPVWGPAGHQAEDDVHRAGCHQTAE